MLLTDVKLYQILQIMYASTLNGTNTGELNCLLKFPTVNRRFTNITLVFISFSKRSQCKLCGKFNYKQIRFATPSSTG